MKKLSLILFSLLLGSAIYAQDNGANPLIKENEIKLNLATTILGLFPEVSYERILDTDISVGASLGAGSSNNQNWLYNFAFTPYFRWHFGGNRSSMRKPASGFFLEANGSMFSRLNEYVEYGNGYDSYKKSEFGAGLGLGLGWKYVSKNDWVGELLLGGGRDFVTNDNGYARIGISIGKRF